MKKLSISIAIAALAFGTLSYSAGAADAPQSNAGTYEQTLPDGRTMVTVIKADNTYTQTVGGAVTETGVVTAAGGKSCFDPQSNDSPTRCYTVSPLGADGSITITPDSGPAMTVKKVG